MPQSAQQAWFATELQRLIERFAEDRDRHKTTALGLKITVVALSGLTTVLIGWRGTLVAPFQHLLPNIALVLSAAVTVFSAYEAFFNPRVLWIQETRTLNQIRDLQRRFEFAVAGAPDQALDRDILNKFDDQLRHIMDESMKSWLKLRGDRDDGGLSPGPSKPS